MVEWKITGAGIGWGMVTDRAIFFYPSIPLFLKYASSFFGQESSQSATVFQELVGGINDAFHVRQGDITLHKLQFKPGWIDFIACKSDENQITNFNISVGVTDEFMNAVKDDKEFELIDPHSGEVWETVRAAELFEQIVKQAHHNGEPGVLFLDAANRTNPVPHLYQLEATNPCGEQWLGPHENCCLGSINLAQHMGEDGAVDWSKLRESTMLATRFLDDVVQKNAYVPAVPQLKEAAFNARRIGLGIMGLADLL